MIGLSLLTLVVGGCYFVPTLAAFSRQHRQRGLILALNIFLGWTIVGWCVALAWVLNRAALPVGRFEMTEIFR